MHSEDNARDRHAEFNNKGITDLLVWLMHFFARIIHAMVHASGYD